MFSPRVAGRRMAATLTVAWVVLLVPMTARRAQAGPADTFPGGPPAGPSGPNSPSGYFPFKP